MKNLVKLIINSEKIMKNEELVLLKGGYDPDTSKCSVSCSSDSECGGACPKCHETAGGWPKPSCQQN